MFVDVGASEFAAALIEQLFGDGNTVCWGNGIYCPDNLVIRVQMAVFLVRTCGL